MADLTGKPWVSYTAKLQFSGEATVVVKARNLEEAEREAKREAYYMGGSIQVNGFVPLDIHREAKVIEIGPTQDKPEKG